MASILNNIVKNTTDINDEVISGSMLSSAKGAADAYLNATMTSTTPELRALYASSLNQVVGGHSALTELVINRGWNNPYDSPTQQLSDVVNKAETTVE
ncbi:MULTISPECIES: spore coat protein [Clostridium]|uniref:Coat F domain protein n=1 Tax=Clostridium ragsdalei P11 TaxID=1353534 RepID=A0A1A6AU26_9CLOT|nr:MULTISPECIES: spore coat protein [Clostridium]OBR93530.1 coat F domain protein [Clostridium ragsdalei P11]QXE19334.1 spore coat protein [Clostridium sp. 001]